MENPQHFESVAATVFLLDHLGESLPVLGDRADVDLAGIELAAVGRMLEEEFPGGLGTLAGEPLVLAVSTLW